MQRHDDGVQGAGRGQSADDARGDRLPGRGAGALQPARARARAGRDRPRRGRPRPAAARFLVSTGRHTGRSPKDKFVVREPSVEPHVWWENNAPMAPDALRRAARRHARPHPGGELFVQDLYAGADPAYRLNVRVITELAWHGLFIRHLLRRPERDGTRRLRARLHHPELPELPGRPGPPRLPLRDGDRHLLRAEADPDRRHRLRRREQEGGLHRAQLPAARAGRDADALLGQPRRRTIPTTSPCSSASPAPARPRSRPTRRAS